LTTTLFFEPDGQHARSTFCLMVMSAADDSNLLTVTTGGVTHAPFFSLKKLKLSL
jgi:hypothetical protein